MDPNVTKRPQNPRATCTYLSAFTLWWTRSIFKLGSKKAINLSDIYQTLDEHSSETLGNKAWQYWEEEKQKEHPKVQRVIFKLFKWEIVLYLILALLRECILRVSQPIFLGYFMSYYFYQQHAITFEQCVLSAVGLVLCSILYSVFGHPCAMGVFHLGMKYRVTLSSIVYRKALRLSNAVLDKNNVGHMINLLSNDIRRFDLGTVLLNYLIVSPIQMCIMAYFIWKEIGLSTLIGLGILVAQIPFQFWTGDRISKVRAQTAALTDKRVQLINEVVSGIQVIKMYSWEDWFSKLIDVCRQNEIKKIKFMSYLRAVNISFRIFNTRLCIFASLILYTLLGNEIDAKKVFVTVCFYEILKQTMTVWFPDSINQMKELSATFKRFENFLLQEESIKIQHLKESNITNGGDETSKLLIKNPLLPHIKFKFISSENCLSSKEELSVIGDNKPDVICGGDNISNVLIIKNIYAKWDTECDKFTLNNVSLNIPKGSVTAITGCVASGKTSLLHTILQELDCLEGYIECNGSISYASQVPWLFSGTISQNILFGSEFDEEYYKEVCRSCALDDDFETFPNGDTTPVGNRGSTLSGGQRGRIGLARALYKDADIYLLDDPFSAVDSKVGKQLFDECVMKMLKSKGKTVVLVTHQVQYLKEADQIIVLKGGSIVSQGTFHSLSKCEEFNKLMLFDGDTNVNESHHTTNNVKHKTKKQIKTAASLKSVETENTSRKSVSWKIYKSYVDTLGNKCFILLFIILAIFTQLLSSGFDYWTKYWVSLEEIKVKNDTNLLVANTFNITADKSEELFTSNNTNYVWSNELCIYTVILISLLFVTLSRTIMFYYMAMKSSIKFHQQMLTSVIRATMNFFYHNNSGKILNRFSQDIGAVDDLLPMLVIEVVQITLQLLGIITLVFIINPWLFIPLLCIVPVLYLLKNMYLRTSQSIIRCEAAARSHVFSHLSASIQGLTTIRAMSAEDIVIKQFDKRNDVYSCVSHMFIGISRAFAYWMDLVCVIFIAVVTFSFLFESDVIGGNIGLAITQVIGLTTLLQWGVRQATALENQMISVERIEEYSNIYPEPPLQLSSDNELPKDWPSLGRIEVDSVYLTYSGCENPSLNGISFVVEPNQRVGIVGRTGAGKSSIINALLRLNSFEGKIKIDGLNITRIGLHTLRNKISIIPQEPVLFSGTLRKNLDPFDMYSDDTLYRALEEVKLKDVMSVKHNVSEGGSNLSVGERQLVCLARAILQDNKIIILDEATANVDNETDSILQETINKKFSNCTIITIAHRLHTIMNSDKILVMESGKIVEFGSPSELLKNKNSVFYSMSEEAGISPNNS